MKKNISPSVIIRIRNLHPKLQERIANVAKDKYNRDLQIWFERTSVLFDLITTASAAEVIEEFKGYIGPSNMLDVVIDQIYPRVSKETNVAPLNVPAKTGYEADPFSSNYTYDRGY